MIAEGKLEAARACLDEAVQALHAGHVADEALARWVQPKRVLGVARPPALKPLGRVWRLGVLLLGHDGALYGTGINTRVTEPGRPQNLHLAVEERRAYREAALKAGYAIGEVVNHDVTPINLATIQDATGPVVIDGNVLCVRWSPAGGLVPFEDYVAERVELALHPPEGA